MILFLSFFLLFIIFILTLNIKVSIAKFKIMNINSKLNFTVDIVLKIGIYIGRKIKLFEVYLDKEKLFKNKYVLKFKKENNLKKDINIIKDEDIKNAIRKIKIRLENLELKLNIGTEDAKLTAILIGILSTIFGILIPIIYYNKNIKLINNFMYKLSPIFSNKNSLKLEIKGGLYIRLLHIIYILYVSLKINKKYDDYRICT